MYLHNLFHNLDYIYLVKNGSIISSGKYDKDMFKVVKKHKAGYIMMHMKGDPINMQVNTNYDNLIESIISFFKLKIEFLKNLEVFALVLYHPFSQ